MKLDGPACQGIRRMPAAAEAVAMVLCFVSFWVDGASWQFWQDFDDRIWTDTGLEQYFHTVQSTTYVYKNVSTIPMSLLFHKIWAHTPGAM